MAGVRNCEHCGAVFESRSEHARFCSSRCRLAWSRLHPGAQPDGDAALGWSVTAMDDAAQRLRKAGPTDLPGALALISEVVWWVTLVDATLIRRHPAAYDRALACLDPAERRKIEGTLTGLHFVRNWMGYRVEPADFIQPQQGSFGGDAAPAMWTWNPVPAPVSTTLPPVARTRETTPYLHYRAHLAGQPAGETITRATTFLTRLSPVS
jgi:hypothetical protein